MARTRPPFAEKQALESLDQLARELRLSVVEAASGSKRPLPAEALACCDILVALFWQSLRVDPRLADSPDHDHFVFNHLQASLAYYATLAKRGFFPAEELVHFDEPGSRLPLFPSPGCVPGVEWGCGATHHGLSIAMGMALSAPIQARNQNVFVLIDDEACLEGLVSESAALAARLSLGNLTAIITTHETTSARTKAQNKISLASRWQSVGWTVREVNGHSLPDLTDSFQRRKSDGTPVAVIATVASGKGFSLAEATEWQDRLLTECDLETARRELQP